MNEQSGDAMHKNNVGTQLLHEVLLDMNSILSNERCNFIPSEAVVTLDCVLMSINDICFCGKSFYSLIKKSFFFC